MLNRRSAVMWVNSGRGLRANFLISIFWTPPLAWLIGFVSTSLCVCPGLGNEYMLGDVVPGVVDAGEKQQQRQARILRLR